MELRDFVRDTLVQIFDGALAARDMIKGRGGAVNPDATLGVQEAVYNEAHGIVEYIEFDVAITEAESGTARGGIGVFLGSVGFGGQAAKTTEAGQLSRVKFRVPLGIPKQ